MTPEERIKQIIESNPKFANVDYEAVLANYYDSVRARNPISLEEIVVSAPRTGSKKKEYYNPRDTELNLKYRKLTEEADALTAKTSEFHKLGNPLSLANHINAGIKYFREGSPYWSTVWNGGSGIFPDNVAQEFPRATAFGNFMFDMAAPMAIGKTMKYVSEPVEYPNGAEAIRVSSPHRYSSKVFKEFPKGFDVASKNAVPESVPLKYEFESLEGNPIYSLKKMRIPNELNPRKLKRMYLRTANKQFFPDESEGFVDLIKPQLNETVGVTDIMQGNIGYPRFSFGLGKYGIIDSSGVMPIQYIVALRKFGGKICQYN